MKNNLHTEATMKSLTNQLQSKFVESWQEKRPTKRKRDRDTYLSPPSRKIKFEIKMKNKENAKVETSKKANSSKKK